MIAFVPVAHAQRRAIFSRGCIPRDGTARCRKRAGSLTTMCMAVRYDLVTLGNVCVDLVVPARAFPIEPGVHQDMVAPASVTCGGAANALIVARRLGLNVAAIGHVGNDTLGQILTSQLHEHGINAKHLVVSPTQSTAACAIITDEDGNHTFIASNERPTAIYSDLTAIDPRTQEHHVPSEFRSALQAARALLIDGYALDDLTFPLLAGCVQIAKQNGALLIFDPQATTRHLAQTNRPLLDYMCSNASILSLTMEEAEDLVLYAGEVVSRTPSARAPTIARARDLCSLLSGKFPSTQYILIKCGAEGSCGLQCSAKPAAAEHAVFVHGIELGDRFVDSTGAGDSFVAAFIAGLLHNGLAPLENLLALANAAGAATCTARGAGPNCATFEAVAAFLPEKLSESLNAQPKDQYQNQPHCVLHVTLECPDAVESAFLKLANELAVHSRKEVGCISYSFARSCDNPRHFMVVERFASVEALDVHSNSEHFKRIVPRFEELGVRTLSAQKGVVVLEAEK
ncbi:5-dehydro-2-deoxygluconokinase [Porphyridium purpureum]|uniref:5-dehydro-2-deoxygluconokinase n=1 Tax=Porphyridium purpureum TaxID=35688 RepID=A0A5J4YLJ5_PORPP|nr:5-dehydro-2-deoxygluconokinase [Porphyridium purpureum]|eukprot:POR8273..scf244_11